jgi:hypothetical protein
VEQQDLGSALRFVAPYRTQWVTTVWLSVEMLLILLFLAALAWAEWTLFRTMGLRALLFLPPSLLGFALLLFMGAYRGVELLWQLAGREELVVDRDGLQLRHVVVVRVTERRYAMSAVAGVSVTTEREPHPIVAWFAPGTPPSRRRYGPSAFESFTRGHVAVGIAAEAPPLLGARHAPEGVHTAHFGSSLEKAEAARIVATIRRRFPGYAGGR